MAKTRVDFNPNEFVSLLATQGYDLLHEKANMCTCFRNGQPSPNCDYCKGTGWVYKTSSDIKAIMTGVGKNIEFGRDGFGRVGTVNITTLSDVRLAYRDRLTLLDGRIIYVENIEDIISTTKELKYAVLDIEELYTIDKIFVKDTDYNVVDNKLVWLTNIPEQYSVRYITYPRWIILNFPNIIRGAQTKVKRPQIVYSELPVKAIAKLEFKITEEDLL